MKKILLLPLLLLMACQENNLQQESTPIIVYGKEIARIIGGTPGPQAPMVVLRNPAGMTVPQVLESQGNSFGIEIGILNKIKNKDWEVSTQITENELSKIKTGEKYWVEASMAGHLLGSKFKNVPNPSDAYYQKLEKFTTILINAGSPTVEILEPALKQLEHHIPMTQVAKLASLTINNVAEVDVRCKSNCSASLPSGSPERVRKEAFLAELKGIVSRNHQ